MKKIGLLLGIIVIFIFSLVYTAKQIASNQINKIVSQKDIQDLSSPNDEFTQNREPEKTDRKDADVTKAPSQQNQKTQNIDKVKQAKKDVSSSDQAKGMSILSKLDIGYIMDLRKDGFTDEEKQKIKQHIQSKLSKKEINELANLYQQYSYLLK